MRLPLALFAITILASPIWADDISPTEIISDTTLISGTEVVSASTLEPSAENVAPTEPTLIPSNAPRNIETTLMLAQRHPQILTSQARVGEARGALDASRANRWFTVNGDAEGGVQFYHDEDGSGTAGVGNAGLSLNQFLTDGGRRKGAITSAEERFAAANDNVAWQQRLRRYAAAQAHINLWLAQQLAQNNADNLFQLEEIVSEVQGRLNQHEATVTELAEAQSRLATARAAQAERIAALGNAQASYLRDVGESVNTVTDPGIGVPAGIDNPESHPLITAARHAVLEAGGQVQQREAGYWPTLDLRGRAGHNAFAGTNRDEGATQAQLTLNLGYTFIDHGVVKGETAAAKAARNAAEADLANTRLEVEAARLNAQSTLTEADRRLSESERAHVESGKVIANLNTEVKQGNRTLRDLLDARRDDLAYANAWAQAYANRTLATYDLERWQ